MMPWVQSSVPYKPGALAQVCNPSTPKVEARGSEVQRHPQPGIHNCLKKKKKKKEKLLCKGAREKNVRDISGNGGTHLQSWNSEAGKPKFRVNLGYKERYISCLKEVTFFYVLLILCL